MSYELKQSQFELIEQRSSSEDLKVLLALIRDHGGVEVVEDDLAENEDGDLELVVQPDPVVLYQAGLLLPGVEDEAYAELGSEGSELGSESAPAGSEAPADDAPASEPSPQA